MKNLFIALVALIGLSSLTAQTALSAGDIAFVGFRLPAGNSAPTASLHFISRSAMASGTTFYVTNQTYDNGLQNYTSKQGGFKIVLNEPISIGQPISITYQQSGTWSAATVSSTVGVVTKEGNDFDFAKATPNNAVDQLWVYQTSGGVTTFITGIFWDTAPALPTGIATTGNSINAVALNISGNSEKCACWTPYHIVETSSTPESSISFSDNLLNTFYRKESWVFKSSNSSGGGSLKSFDNKNVHNNVSTIDACNPFTGTGASAPLEWLTTNIIFDKYRWGRTVNTWEGFTLSSNTWTTTSAPDWSTNSAEREIILYQNLNLGGGSVYGTFDPANPASSDLQVAKLTIKDSVNNNVTLTIAPGSILTAYYGISMEDLSVSTGSPKIKLSSALGSDGNKYFAQIAPTAADLSGTYDYELIITKPGWHHFYSPISTQLSDVGISPQSGSSTTFAFDATGSTLGFRNIYSWDPLYTNNSFWQPVASTFDLSSLPSTIYFRATDVPVKLTISGTKSIIDQNIQTVNGAGYYNVGSTTSPGYGAPGWQTAAEAGWNFYGNPFLSYISTASLVSNYSSTMSDLDLNVYAWQANRVTINGSTNYYVSNGTTGDAAANYIPPFQGIFMRRPTGTNGTTANGGFVYGKKYRVAGLNYTSVVFKGATTGSSLALSLSRPNWTGSLSAYLDAFPDTTSQAYMNRRKAPFSGSFTQAFAISADSSFWTILPIHSNELLDSLRTPVMVAVAGHGTSASISNHEDFNSSFESILIDHYTQTRHNLTSSDYTFINDTTQQSVRFTWVLKPQQMDISETSTKTDDLVWHQQGQDLIIDLTGQDASWLEVFGSDGKVLFSGPATTERLEINNLPTNQVFVLKTDSGRTAKAILY